jgi:hypothetical protein
MLRQIPGIGFTLLAACAANDKTVGGTVGGDDGKADGPGSVSTTGTWTREVIANNAELWNGGPVGWGAGTSIAVRADGHPIVAYYDATNRCNNGGFGTYSPDTLEVARVTATGWKSTIEACGPYAGYWPRLRVDSADRTHAVFGAGWFSSGEQRAFYVRWSSGDQREAWNLVDGGYMSDGALALALDDTDAPIVVSDGDMVAPDGTKSRIFASDTMRTFAERDATGALHVVGSTMIPDPGDPSSSTSLLRYARRDTSGVTIENPRTEPISTPLGLVLDSTGAPHLLSWNRAAMGGGELWHTVRTDTGWVDELIASGIYEPNAAMAIGAGDELLVVAPGQLFRRGPVATAWTTTPVTALSSARYLSAIVAPDGTLHVAFEIVGPIMSNEVSRASVYHVSFH